jgi:hypothetical protein
MQKEDCQDVIIEIPVETDNLCYLFWIFVFVFHHEEVGCLDGIYEFK